MANSDAHEIVLHPKKKARTGREERSAAASVAHPEFTLYFDKIPQEEILYNILRHLSLLPHAGEIWSLIFFVHAQTCVH